MKRQVLQDLLTRHAGAKADGDAMTLPDGAETSLFVAMGIEPLVIDRVATIVLESESLVAETRRKERYMIAYEDLRAVRVSDDSSGRAGY